MSRAEGMLQHLHSAYFYIKFFPELSKATLSGGIPLLHTLVTSAAALLCAQVLTICLRVGWPHAP